MKHDFNKRLKFTFRQTVQFQNVPVSILNLHSGNVFAVRRIIYALSSRLNTFKEGTNIFVSLITKFNYV